MIKFPINMQKVEGYAANVRERANILFHSAKVLAIGLRARIIPSDEDSDYLPIPDLTMLSDLIAIRINSQYQDNFEVGFPLYQHAKEYARYLLGKKTVISVSSKELGVVEDMMKPIPVLQKSIFRPTITIDLNTEENPLAKLAEFRDQINKLHKTKSKVTKSRRTPIVFVRGFNWINLQKISPDMNFDSTLNHLTHDNGWVAFVDGKGRSIGGKATVKIDRATKFAK